jgi:hypothetical protein
MAGGRVDQPSNLDSCHTKTVGGLFLRSLQGRVRSCLQRRILIFEKSGDTKHPLGFLIETGRVPIPRTIQSRS